MKDTMQLQNQIESINNPQEFTRLYNAILSIEYAEDYLPIDDDQADGGNDGYLKSEKRIFAGHCFKRVQKQKINKEILDKMSSDLAKAITLRDVGRWEIKSWTFLCNYPISEDVGVAILKLGKDSGIDVSWRGSDYFATALQKYQDVREQFPNLIATDIQAKLDAIIQKLEKPDDDNIPITQVPDNALDQERLLIEMPAYWEYLYFASVLLTGKENLELKWKDHIMHHARPSGVTFDKESGLHHFNNILSQLTQVTSGLTIAFKPENMEQAFGKPGENGDPLLIKHFAMHVVNSYEDTLDWAYRLRAATFPDEFSNLVEACAEIADQPASEMRDFIVKCVDQANRIHPHLNSPQKSEDLRLEMIVTLTTDDKVIKRYIKEFKKLRRRI